MGGAGGGVGGEEAVGVGDSDGVGWGNRGEWRRNTETKAEEG